MHLAINRKQNKRTIYFLLLLIFTATTLIYWKTGSHEFISYDDGIYVYENPSVQLGLTFESFRWAFSTINGANWHPLTNISHIIDVQLYGLQPRGHHLTNVFFHVTNSMLLLLILVRMTGSIWRSSFVAFLFALHPLHVESVAWVAERKDVLSAFFFMLTLLAYIRYCERPVLIRYSIVFLTFVMGLMSKPMLVTLPFVLLLLDLWPLNRLEIGNRLSVNKNPTMAFGQISVKCAIEEKIPLFIISFLSSLVTYYAQKTVGTVASIEMISFGKRFANAMVAYTLYMWKTVYPLHLTVLYPLTTEHSPLVVIGAVSVLTVISLIAFHLRYSTPFLLVGWLWFLGTLVPVIGLVQVGAQSMADRYTYIPLIGIFILLSWGGAEILRIYQINRIVTYCIFLAIIGFCSLATWFQLDHWSTSQNLYEYTLKYTENNYIINNNLCVTLIKNRQFSEAVKYCTESLRIKPDYADARIDLSAALIEQGKIDEGIEQMKIALRIRPNDAILHGDLANVLFQHGKVDEAILHYQDALKINPNSIEFRRDLVRALQSKGLPATSSQHSLHSY